MSIEIALKSLRLLIQAPDIAYKARFIFFQNVSFLHIFLSKNIYYFYILLQNILVLSIVIQHLK